DSRDSIVASSPTARRLSDRAKREPRPRGRGEHFSRFDRRFLYNVVMRTRNHLRRMVRRTFIAMGGLLLIGGLYSYWVGFSAHVWPNTPDASLAITYGTGQGNWTVIVQSRQ